jgi:hypothetical protein
MCSITRFFRSYEVSVSRFPATRDPSAEPNQCGGVVCRVAEEIEESDGDEFE